MHDLRVDIATQDACFYSCPDGIHKFRLPRRPQMTELANVLWSAAHLYVPFFSTSVITRFVVYDARRTPLFLEKPFFLDNDPRACEYLGRADCMQYGDLPGCELFL